MLGDGAARLSLGEGAPHAVMMAVRCGMRRTPWRARLTFAILRFAGQTFGECHAIGAALARCALNATSTQPFAVRAGCGVARTLWSVPEESMP